MHTHGQVEQTRRLELLLGAEEASFEVIPAENDGLFLHRRLSATGADQIDIVKLDTALNEQWHGFLPVPKNYMMAGKRTHNSQLYLLFRAADFSRNDLELYSLNSALGQYTRYQIKSFIPIQVTEFQVTSDAALIGGYFNHVPLVIHFSFTAEKSKVLPGMLNESGDLNQVRTYPDGSFDVLICARNYLKQKTVWIKNYDAEGNLKANYPLQTEDRKSLLFGRSIKSFNQMQVVAGVYGNRNSEYSKGLFVTTIDPIGNQQTRYYNFADLENFFKYLKARRQNRIKNRIDRRKIKGKKIRFNYRFLVHELIPYNGQYILLGEAFYPRYITVDRTYYGGFFNPSFVNRGMVQNGRIFDGYFYTHAVVIGFEEDGKLVWDNSFEINDVRTFTLEQFVRLEPQEDRIALFYLFGNEIRSKIIQDNKVLEGKASDPIMTRFKSDVTKEKEATQNKLDYWYADYFYASGVQEILNWQEANVNPKRRVFFVNKLRYR
ncbi:MAG: hypothetical protein HC859_05205 [Bacteroidia bacterium]|nr:hypothetical protein [Bacteroidia bacterium]